MREDRRHGAGLDGERERAGAVELRVLDERTQLVELRGGLAGIATVLPKHGMSLTIGYMLVDVFIGAMPFSLRELSITHQTAVLARLGSDPPATSSALIAMAVVAGVWSVVAFARIRLLET
jgi:hypothetical protein